MFDGMQALGLLTMMQGFLVVHVPAVSAAI